MASEYDEKTLLDRVEKVLLDPEATHLRQNVDVSLQEKFAEYFPIDSASLVFEKNPGKERMKKRISQKHIDRLIDNFAEIEEIQNSTQLENEKCDSRNLGKHFSLVDSEGQVTIAFEVISVLDESKKMFVRSYLEELDYTDESLSDGRTKRTFYIDYSYYYGMPICTKIALITFCPKEQYLLINNAVVKEIRYILQKILK